MKKKRVPTTCPLLHAADSTTSNTIVFARMSGAVAITRAFRGFFRNSSNSSSE
ncbi:MAG: hypothetical protein HY905_13985 [Deltaproteobacteria bacterium]|nr:hypothetical protein [Deltaproteobacteria bacterium]